MEVEQLNERIAQLSELVKSMEATLKAVEEERNRLVVQQKETESKFERVKEKEEYYLIDFDRYRDCVVNSDTEEGHFLDEASYDNNNYFRTEKRAQEVVDKIHFLLRLERLHDTYCPDYTPDWKNSNELKYSVFYDNYSGHYHISMFSVNDYKNNTFFATKEIAQKVCNILNKELEEKE
jgi:hypothetical protein